MEIQTKIKKFNQTLHLESGRSLSPFSIAYETYGEMNEKKDNVIVVCHALTGSHHVAGFYEGDEKPGWWNEMIGDDKTIDTKKFFVICANVIGSCFGSTGPMSKKDDGMPYRFNFPVITVKDMVNAQMVLFEFLGISEVHAVIGGSMGGMQALHFAVDYPLFAKNIISLASTHAASAWAIAFNKVAIEAIRNDKDFKDGQYEPKVLRKTGLRGAAIARMTGHITYLSPHSMNEKFSRQYVERDGLFDLFGRFQVESYLEYNGNNFIKWFDPLSFIYLSKAINIYDISRSHDDLKNALSHVRSKLFLISFASDLLFLPQEMSKIKQTMDELGLFCDLKEVPSDYGHDAFLVQLDRFKDHIKEIINARNT